jgi:DNA repair protein RecN (Recombination protein N)
MLKTLTVWNFALIEHVSIDFTTGLNILTGETGAGKSILIDSVGVILGYRTTTDNIRNGNDWLQVEAVFDITNYQEIYGFLADHTIVDNEDTLIISRRVSRNGKNLISVNGCHITLALLKTLGEKLVDIHGQHENQALLKPGGQFSIVDNYNPAIKDKLVGYRQTFNEWRKQIDVLDKKETDSREHAQRIDMLKWQTDEIAAAKLKDHEDDELEAEIKLLSNSEKIADLVKRSYILLEQGDKGHSAIIPSLVELKKNIEMISRYDERASNNLSIITEALCQLEECNYDIRSYGENLDYTPERLIKLQERMDVIYKLRKKYGATIEDVLLYYKKAKDELSDIENYDQIIADLKADIARIENKLIAIGKELTLLRSKVAIELATEIQSHLIHLGMPNANLMIAVKQLGKLNQNGADDIVMLFSANAGEEPKVMQKVASGGELSRIALAIKAVCAAKDNIGVMIFDEIDTGIGGKTAQMVAERIAMVAVHKQVLCITHLPQIACMADCHIYIDKQVQEGKTTTKIKRLLGNEQINELARMASGSDVTETSLNNASEMLQHAIIKKEKWENKAHT